MKLRHARSRLARDLRLDRRVVIPAAAAFDGRERGALLAGRRDVARGLAGDLRTKGRILAEGRWEFAFIRVLLKRQSKCLRPNVRLEYVFAIAQMPSICSNCFKQNHRLRKY